MWLNVKSEFLLKNKIAGDRYVNGTMIVPTRHAKDRKRERQFDDQHIIECLEHGVVVLGNETGKHTSRPFKNTATVLRNGIPTQATTVYALSDEKVQVITVYYHKK